MEILSYILVVAGTFLVDLIPLIGPPAWTVMIALQVKFDLNIWVVLLLGVSGSALGRYQYSIYIRQFSGRFIKERKNADLLFIGARLANGGWKVHLFVLLYSLIPTPKTPLFTASGVAGIRPVQILPAFFAGKFVSDALMLSAGKYIIHNLSSIAAGMLRWQSLLGTGMGFMLICLFFFIDWKTLLLERKFRISLRIWK